MKPPGGLDPVTLTGLYAANSDAIYQLDLDGRFVHGNEALCAMTGYDIAQLRGLTFRDVIHPEDLPQIEVEFARAVAGDRRRYQTRGISRDGSIFRADVTKFPVQSDDGTVIAILGVARDLEPVREAVLTNDRMTAVMRIAARLHRIAGWSFDVPTREFAWSSELYALLEASPRDGTADQLTRRLILDADRFRLEAALRTCIESGEPFELRANIRTFDDRDMVMQIAGEAVRDGDGTVIRIDGGFVDMTNPLAEQEAALRAEERLRSTLDQVEDGISFIGRDWRLTYLNRASARWLDLNVEGALDRTIWEHFPEITDNAVGDLYRAAMDHGERGTVRVFSTEYQRWFEVSAAPTDDGIGSIVRDVTGDELRRQTLASYTREVEAQAALIDATDDAMIVTGLDGTVEFWNQGAERIYELSRDEAIGVSVHDLAGAHEAIVDGREARQVETITRSGRKVLLDRRERLLGGAGGEPTRILYVDTDVTEVSAQRAAARALDERLRTTLDQISDGICFLDKDWRYTFINKAAERMMQIPNSESLGVAMWDLYPDLRPSEFGIAYRRTMRDRVVSTVRDHFASLDTWFEITSYPTDEGIMLYFRDVGEVESSRREIEAQTRRIRDQATLLEAAREAMVVRDLHHVVQYWNTAATELYGWTAHEAVGRSIFDLIYQDTSEFEIASRRMRKDGYWSGDLHHRRRDGSTVVVESRWQLVRGDDGEPAAIFCINTDVTDLRKKQAQDIRAQRMESLGTLAGGIAHDLNNVLTPILMSVQLLSMGEQDPRRLELLTTMDTGVKRGAEMIRQVLSFARGIESAKAVISVEALLDEVVTFCRDTLPKSVTADVAIETSLWPVVGDHTQLMQVLVNLVTNARDAMPRGGIITIRARNVELDEPYRAATNLVARGSFVAIDVEDSGEGMTEEISSKIFEPFFTTKPQGAGTGLGLPTSMAIVRSHGGYIQVYSEPGVGSRFHLHLPAAPEDAVLDGDPDPQTEVRDGRGERVLVVDDESAIRETVSRTLVEHGYEPLVAGNGREAIDIIDAAESPIDLVLTDMMMPVMDGAATVDYLHEHHPRIAIIAASGLNAHSGAGPVRDLGVSHFLAKPYTTVTLLTALREALDAR